MQSVEYFAVCLVICSTIPYRSASCTNPEADHKSAACVLNQNGDVEILLIVYSV